MENYREKVKILIDEINGNNVILHLLPSDEFDSIMIMASNGKAFCRIYWYNDDFDNVYLADLSVDEDIRKRKVGTKLQELRETIGQYLGATTVHLFVKKDSWQHEWYLRRGYIDEHDCDDEDDIWMKKELNDQLKVVK